MVGSSDGENCYYWHSIMSIMVKNWTDNNNNNNNIFTLTFFFYRMFNADLWPCLTQYKLVPYMATNGNGYKTHPVWNENHSYDLYVANYKSCLDTLNPFPLK